ncbi:MAG: hypothetical protein Q7T29_16330, partial [Gallionella sp.]|nr:hypothetical protein [Gallionella sp.]
MRNFSALAKKRARITFACCGDIECAAAASDSDTSPTINAFATPKERSDHLHLEATRSNCAASILGAGDVMNYSPARLNWSRFSLPGAPKAKSSTMKLY